MKMLWCWRCKAEMPMLTDEGFALVAARSPVPHKISLRQERAWRDFLDEYERITGYRETNQNAIYHHVLSYYGPPCAACGKPLRSPRAKLCGACMAPVVHKPLET